MAKQDNNDGQEDSLTDLPEVEQELSKVAASPKRSMLILAGVVVIFLYLLFNLFINTDSPNKPSGEPIPTDIVKPTGVSTNSTIPAIPTLPTPPKLEDPTPPPPPVMDALPPPAAQESAPLPVAAEPGNLSPSLPSNEHLTDDEARKKMEAKRKSSIILIAGSPPAKTPEQIEQETDFKFRGDMRLVLGRGKMIDAIIETAINTDFGGEIRAIITRDVYSEWGRNILIPKGSRVFGNYVTGTNGAYGRIAIEWNRVDLSNGYTINMGGTGTDALGRKGQQGRMDNKFKERFINAILRSAFNVTLARTLDTLVKPATGTQAAANQTTAGTNITNTATGIFANSNLSDAQKYTQICASVLSVITDKTSTAFTTINNLCTTLATQTGTTDADRLTALMNGVNSAASALIQTSSVNTQPSQAQQASKQAFTDISDTAKELLDKQKFDPTITIDQGTPIKIYVNKDYKFPKEAVKKVTR